MINENQSTNNPLAPFMRHPEVYIKLPSQGKFYSQDDVVFTASGEIAVSSMTANDDLLLKTPEGLLNGDSISKVIQSCCPGIKNVNHLLVPDLDVILLAIRQASYGDIMDFEIKCPKCSYEGIYKLSISESLLNIEVLESEYSLELTNNVTIYLNPFTFENSIKESLKKYQEAQAMKSLLDEDFNENEEYAAQFTKSLNSLADLMIELCADSIIKIVGPDDQEIKASKEQTREWVKFLPRKDAALIQEKLSEINSVGIDKTKTVTCSECDHVWDTEVNFDPSVFFGKSS